MKVFYLLNIIVFLIARFECKNLKIDDKKQQIKGVIVKKNFPVLVLDSVQNTWVVDSYDSMYTRIYYFNNLTLIQKSVKYDSINLLDGIVTSSKKGIRFYSFVFDSVSPIGVFFNTPNLASARLIKKDSMLADEWVFNTKKDELLTENRFELLQTINNADNDIIENYSLVNIKDTTMKGTLQLIFSKTKLSGFGYSMAPGIEKSRGMKLIKISYVNFPRYLASGNTNIGRIEIPYQLSELKIDDDEELIKLFEKARDLIK